MIAYCRTLYATQTGPELRKQHFCVVATVIVSYRSPNPLQTLPQKVQGEAFCILFVVCVFDHFNLNVFLLSNPDNFFQCATHTLWLSSFFIAEMDSEGNDLAISGWQP